MRTSVLFITVLVVGISCEQKSSDSHVEENQQVETTYQSKPVTKGPEFTVITVEYPNVGWGYQILQDGKLAIDQKHIPVIQGYRGFSSMENAEKTGNFIVEKMKKGIFPPTLTEEELDSLKVI